MLMCVRHLHLFLHMSCLYEPAGLNKRLQIVSNHLLPSQWFLELAIFSTSIFNWKSKAFSLIVLSRWWSQEKVIERNFSFSEFRQVDMVQALNDNIVHA